LARQRDAAVGLIEPACVLGVADRRLVLALCDQRLYAPMTIMPVSKVRQVQQVQQVLMPPGGIQCAQAGRGALEVASTWQVRVPTHSHAFDKAIRPPRSALGRD